MMRRYVGSALATALLLLLAACGHVPRPDQGDTGAAQPAEARGMTPDSTARAGLPDDADRPSPDTTGRLVETDPTGHPAEIDSTEQLAGVDSTRAGVDSLRADTTARERALRAEEGETTDDTGSGAPGARDSVRTREVEVSADRLEGGVENGERVRRLIGNVRLRQEETRLWARRAVQFLDRDEILFIGEVLIVERGDTLRADSVLYNSAQKTGRADGNVRLTDGDVLVRAPSGFYYTREKRAQFMEGVTLQDSTALLASREGEYWSDERRAEFYGAVRLDEERTHLEADSVTYLREDDVSIARGNVFIERIGSSEEADADSLTRTLLFGDWAYNEDSTEYSRIEGRPLLIRLRQDSVAAKVDTLLIRARVLEASRQDSLQRLIATDSVRIWRHDLAATADSVVYDRVVVEDRPANDRVRMYGDPIAWLQENQVTGDTIRVHAVEEQSDTLFVDGNAFVAREDSALKRIHQLRGETLVAVTADDSLRTLTVGPQAEAINFRTNENDEPGGAVQMSADRIVFHFDGDEVQRIRAIRGTEGTYYTEELLPSDLQLDGFRWVPERRPTRERLLGEEYIPLTSIDSGF